MADELIDLTTKDISDVKIQTSYCITQSVHDAQVMATIKKNYPPMTICSDIKYEPIAVVCSGTSLNDTWQEIKKFSHIITCSGAHDFLIERGIMPQYHSEADPRKHKAVFTKNPMEGITYLIASCCHQDVFKNLVGHDVKVWHVLGSDKADEIPAIYPRGHVIVSGGSNVGLRALVLSRVLGFTNIHVFGMDCSSNSETFHANYHPNEPKDKNWRKVKIGERVFTTTEVFMEYARQFFHETSMLHDTSFYLHGEGMLQALAAQKFSDPDQVTRRMNEVAKRNGKSPMIALTMPNTISNEYCELNKQLHEARADYGAGGAKYAKVVMDLMVSIGAKSCLDYGCGKGLLAKSLPFPIWEYDPAIPEKSHPPRPADLVVNTDVMEHIEPEFLDSVITDIARCTKKLVYFVIHTQKSGKTLADGRNTHLIQKDAQWWKEKLSKWFILRDDSVISRPPLVHIVAAKK